MSFEGYKQCICDNGHYFEIDVYEDDDVCLDCGGKIAWFNTVDDTNCNSYGEIPMELLEEKFRVKKVVVERGCFEMAGCVEPVLFRIPTREETDPLRHYRPEYGGTPLVPLPE